MKERKKRMNTLKDGLLQFNWIKREMILSPSGALEEVIFVLNY